MKEVIWILHLASNFHSNISPKKCWQDWYFNPTEIQPLLKNVKSIGLDTEANKAQRRTMILRLLGCPMGVVGLENPSAESISESCSWLDDVVLRPETEYTLPTFTTLLKKKVLSKFWPGWRNLFFRKCYLSTMFARENAN